MNTSEYTARRAYQIAHPLTDHQRTVARYGLWLAWARERGEDIRRDIRRELRKQTLDHSKRGAGSKWKRRYEEHCKQTHILHPQWIGLVR